MTAVDLERLKIEGIQQNFQSLHSPRKGGPLKCVACET